MRTLFPFAILLFLLGKTVQAQEVALAYPVETINIDGNFSDWPASVNWYRMRHTYQNDDESNEDFAAQFAVAYNMPTQTLFIAIKVLDDDFVGANGESHTTQDHMLLYLDAAHTIDGGTPMFYVATDRILEVHHKPGTFDTRNHFLTKDKAQVARKRMGNTLQYEWKITMDDHIKPDTSLGLDFMLIDHDTGSDNETVLVWKDGFGKSYGSQKLGDVLLLDQGAEAGKVKGKLDLKSIGAKETINSMNIVSREKPEIWLQATLDTTGYFQAFLPVGEYELRPNRRYTSPINSSGFNQNTRKLEYGNMTPFRIDAQETTVLDSIQLKIISKPKIPTIHSEGLPIESISTNEIDAFVSDWKEYWQIPAVSIVLIRNNKVFFDKTIGVKSNFKAEKVDHTTLFEAASITKSVFAVIVLRLAEKGLLDLDKPLYHYLTFPNIDKDERSKLLTARIVLGHRSGLPNWAWGGPGSWKGGGEIQLGFEPGTQFGYSGEAFNYLGRVVEKITGKSLQALYEEEIEKPFGIKNSHFYYTDAQEKRFALGHTHQYPQIKEKERIASPASSLSTNAHLFKNFVLNLMNEKKMRKSSYELIYTPYTVLKPEQKIYDPETPQYISHGFFVQDTPHGKLIAHGGNNGDYDCKFAYNPDKKYGYIVFTNSNLGDEFVRALEQYLLGSTE